MSPSRDPCNSRLQIPWRRTTINRLLQALCKRSRLIIASIRFRPASSRFPRFPDSHAPARLIGFPASNLWLKWTFQRLATKRRSSMIRELSTYSLRSFKKCLTYSTLSYRLSMLNRDSSGWATLPQSKSGSGRCTTSVRSKSKTESGLIPGFLTWTEPRRFSS
jgi:hypothetical protein